MKIGLGVTHLFFVGQGECPSARKYGESKECIARASSGTWEGCMHLTLSFCFYYCSSYDIECRWMFYFPSFLNKCSPFSMLCTCMALWACYIIKLYFPWGLTEISDLYPCTLVIVSLPRIYLHIYFLQQKTLKINFEFRSFMKK